jgi:cytochrome c
MKTTIIVMTLAGLAISSQANANAELAKAKNCMVCHAPAVKMVGPSYKDIAAKYAGDAAAEDKLVKKVLKGSVGVWGSIPMPANSQVSESDARTLVKWILATGK